tara:strand:- start:4801 stop:5067 length:267 start_codon:yes stop_codon:yes gene_type:complete
LKFSKWIYNLRFEEYLVISVLFIISVIISFQSIKLLNIWNKKLNNENKFSREFRASPIPLFGLSIIISAILFLIFGDFFVNLLKEKIN